MCSLYGDEWRVNKTANTISISRERVESMLHKLGMAKVSVLWLPRLLTLNQMHTRLITSQEESAGFLERFLSQDECFVHHFRIETNRQSMQWKYPSSPAPNKFTVVLFVGKLMASVFLDAKGIVFIKYL